MPVRPTGYGLLVILPASLLLMPLTAGCTGSSRSGAATPGSGTDSRHLTVRATDAACTVTPDSAPSGSLRFTVTNASSSVTEFLLLDQDQLRIVGKVEDLGPGLARDLVVTAAPGAYFSVCKPGLAGVGIRAPFSVSDSGTSLAPAASNADLVNAATTSYAAYVERQTDQLMAGTAEFMAAYLAGRDDQARALYPKARTHWERIETLERFADLDARMDLPEAELAHGELWTGWHRLEKDLWPARARGYQRLSKTDRRLYAEDLAEATEQLQTRARTTRYTTAQIANATKELMEEAATAKVTGRAEYWSRTDLWDLQANLDGARAGYEALRPLVRRQDPNLAAAIDTKMAALQKLLDRQRKGDGFASYDSVSEDGLRQLSDAVNGLSEPLSQLTAASREG
jgi:iron uptake system component EfeO